ncbi:hypothetical protein HANVADRAFT_51006 [Hanseniaspora valbyensis NRRL Y-1626]|uniref:Uncharacterized protein n=1 Tax=Hanseniaspora valbyensis NRRL Y-1626 TaxID=766949 RepID=A0A1B7TK01_9ASCO|nr:hypothetical protein HANVADRAFT_51006 [Hanseniaspora valbyensis NRRL Y-1626]
MVEANKELTAEIQQLRTLETEIISLYFNTVSNYSKLNKNLAKKVGLDNTSITKNYSNIIDLQLQIFDKLLVDFDKVENIEEYKEKIKVLLETLQQAS